MSVADELAWVGGSHYRSRFATTHLENLPMLLLPYLMYI